MERNPNYHNFQVQLADNVVVLDDVLPDEVARREVLDVVDSRALVHHARIHDVHDVHGVHDEINLEHFAEKLNSIPCNQKRCLESCGVRLAIAWNFDPSV